MLTLTIRPAPCGSPGVFACQRPADALDYGLAPGWPVLSLLGGAGGAAIAGERFPGGAAFFGTLLGMSFTAPMWFAARELWFANSSTPMAPFIALTAPLVGAGTALAIDYRGEQLARAERLGLDLSAPPSRVLLGGAASLATTLLAGAAVGGGGALLCPGKQPVCFAALSLPALVLPALAAWGVHRARGGRGTLASAVLGMTLAGVATASMILASSFEQGTPRGPGDFFWPGLGGMAMVLPAAMLGAPFALEASHAEVLLEEAERHSR